MIKAIIFDYGGVIKSSHRCKDEIALAYGVPYEVVAEVIKPFMEDFRKGLVTEDKFWKQLSVKLKKPVPKNKNNLWRECYEKTFFVYPEIIEFIKKIKKRGIKTAILSNTIFPHLKIIKKHDDFKDFDALIFSCEVGLTKPNPEIYLLAIKQLNVEPKECVFIDDLEKNLVPAEKLGMKTILARIPQQVIKDISVILGKEKRRS